MAVRKIPISGRSITGRQAMERFPKSVPFESLLERDFLLLMDFDHDVEGVESQPVCVDWTDTKGKARRYTPDFLVTFRSCSAQLPPFHPGKRRPWLVEVRSRKELLNNWPTYRQSFRAATRFASRRGWIFHVRTEARIRGSQLSNAKWLLPYLRLPADPQRDQALLAQLEAREGATPQDLVRLASQDSREQARLLPRVWSLIAQRLVCADFHQPVGLQSQIWLAASRPSERAGRENQ